MYPLITKYQPGNGLKGATSGGQAKENRQQLNKDNYMNEFVKTNNFVKNRETMQFFNNTLSCFKVKDNLALKIKDASTNNPLIEYLLKYGDSDKEPIIEPENN